MLTGWRGERVLSEQALLQRVPGHSTLLHPLNDLPRLCYFDNSNNLELKRH